MKANVIPSRTVDEYISKYPEKVQLILQKFRETIKKAAPEAEEIISYQMPAFKQNGNLVYFGDGKTKLDFTLLHPEPLPSKKKFLFMRVQKALVNFRLINQC